MSPRRAVPLSIEYALLGLLTEQPLHGYELYQRLLAPAALGAVWPLKRSQFYALVAKLAQVGYLTREQEQHEQYPPRQLLRLTPSGATAFAAWLDSPVTHDADLQRDLSARLYFARRKGVAAVAALVARQRAASRHERADLQRQLAALIDPASFAARVLQLRLRQVEAVLAWLDTQVAPDFSATLLAYPIAPLVDSPHETLARQFVHYVCSPAGQTILQSHGFLAAVPAATGERPVPAARDAAAERRTLTVFAAASLTAALRELGVQFEADNPGLRIDLQFAGSHHLAQQLTGGATADVFVAAHHAAFDQVIAAGRVAAADVQICAYNRLAIATLRSRSPAVVHLADLAQRGRRLVLGSDATAIGHYALALLDQGAQQGELGPRGRLAVLQNIVGYADSPQAVLDQVVSGAADVGIVFASDCVRLADQIVSPLLYPATLAWHSS